MKHQPHAPIFLKQNECLKENEGYFIKYVDGRLSYVNEYFLDIVYLVTNIRFRLDDVINQKGEDIFPRTENGFFSRIQNDTINTMCTQIYNTSFSLHNKSIYVEAITIPIFQNQKLHQITCRIRYLNIYKVNQRFVIISSRELQILSGLCLGLSAKSMSYILNIREGSVTTYVNRVKKKLNAHNHLDLLTIVRKHALLFALIKYATQIYLPLRESVKMASSNSL